MPPIVTDKNTQYGPPLVNQKYAPLLDIQLGAPDAEAIALGAPTEVPPPPYAPPYDPSTAIAEVIDVVRAVAGGDLPDRLEQEFSRALWSLAMHQP